MMCCFPFRGVPSLLLLAAVLLPLVFGSGCGKKESPVTDDVRVIGPVTSLSEVSGDPTAFKNMFADGAAPKETERKEYGKYAYEVKSRKVSGDTATLTVVITDPASGSTVGEKEWKAVRVNDKWKLQEAPLK